VIIVTGSRLPAHAQNLLNLRSMVGQNRNCFGLIWIARTAVFDGISAMQVAIMRSNALNLVSVFLLFPTALALLFAWQAKEPVDYDLALVVWLWFGLPGLMLATFLFWLGRPNRPQRDADQASSGG
jgi:hypothetical protein